MTHIGENAELYALGALDDKERMQVEHHAGSCKPCMNLLSNAERIVADIELELPALAPPPHLELRLIRSARVGNKRVSNLPLRYRSAVAALIVLGIISTIMGLRLWKTDGQLRQNDTILAAMSSSDFGHLTFRSRGAGTIGKAICEKHGNWIYLVVTRMNADVTLYGRRNGNHEELGRPMSQGRTATLFVEKPGKFSDLELVADGRVVAEAKTHYPR